MSLNIFVHMLLSISALAVSIVAKPVRVESYVNTDEGLDMVSSVVIGSEAAMIIDLPITIGKAKELATWIKAITDRPLVAAFTSHNHPDHYLSGASLFDEFPGIQYYANSRAAKEIQGEAAMKVEYWSGIYGADNVVQNTTMPMAYDFGFFALPGDEDSPVYLLNPLTGDTIDETLFWIPAIGTLIAADSVWGRDLHLWMADLLTRALTESWLATVEFISDLKPLTIVPGHTVSNASFDGSQDFNHTYAYLKFWQEQIESRGPDYFTPTEIFDKLSFEFPGLLTSNSRTILNRLNITAENFGRGGKRQVHYQPLATFNDSTVLEGWLW
ncbi:beta-lactamase-like protein [Lipomyces starkeyi]|uniref:Metallo-beta-lactamase domain-containing protein n=1 Tax=Lipomyces starkeyi NRRL Y-11557 TaxID=675824 RepID=A0A1E3PX15_LIPST|nr:hypothetical protein LIPSTDRAFT_6613 [Lipomyces starkeyi NRRL Y-11557]